MHGTAEYELEGMFGNPAENSRIFNIPQEDQRLFALAYWSKKFFSATADQFLSFLQNNYKGICMLPVLTDAALIIDEVHSFDHAMFSSLLSFLRHFDIPVLCMTATLAPKNKQSLLNLGLQVYPAESDLTDLEDLIQLKENYPRYNKFLLGNYEEALAIALENYAAGKKVLWVLNTVRRCQEAHASLEQALQIEIPCYHSRFRLEDRKNIHGRTIEAFKAGNTSGKAIAVTTQVCEMSLDLDADILITELAPISSMVQRFGRANRHLKNSAEFRAGLYYYSPSGSCKPYSPQEIDAAEKFMLSLPAKDISQKTMAENLESFSEQEYSILPAASFIDGGYYALARDYRDTDEFTVQAILDTDWPEVALCLKKRKPIDSFILPTPKEERNEPQAIHSALPKYLWVVSADQYTLQRGYAA